MSRPQATSTLTTTPDRSQTHREGGRHAGFRCHASAVRPGTEYVALTSTNAPAGASPPSFGSPRGTPGKPQVRGPFGPGSWVPCAMASLVKPPETGRGRQQPLRFRERWGRIRSKEAKDLPGLKVAICHESNLTAKVTAGTACATSTSALHARRLSRSWRAARRGNGVETDPLDRVRAGRPLVRASWSRWCRCPPGGQTEALALERPTRNPTRSDLGPGMHPAQPREYPWPRLRRSAADRPGSPTAFAGVVVGAGGAAGSTEGRCRRAASRVGRSGRGRDKGGSKPARVADVTGEEDHTALVPRWQSRSRGGQADREPAVSSSELSTSSP
jgi:hypothetical protein